MKTAGPGAAIVAAMLTVALVAALVMTGFWYIWRSTEAEAGWRQQAQARWLLGGVLDWAMALLQDDGRLQAQVDHLGEPWAQTRRDLSPAQLLAQGEAPASAEAPDFTLSLQIADAQAKLNLLNLLEGSGLSAPWSEVFARLFAQLNLPASELDLMQQALLRASAGTGEGASGQSPLMPQRAEDLHWLGLLPATVAALRPHLTVLPGRLPVNLNTADAVVLQAVLGGGSVAMDALLARRKAQPLGSLADAGLGGPGGPAASDQLSVNSNFFEVQTSVQLGRAFRLGQRALLQRQGPVVRILWRY
jgi:general secretion pathway protein K